MLIKRDFSNQEEMRHEVTKGLVTLIRAACANREQFHLALTGGEVGGLIARELAEHIDDAPENFAGLHIWWSDERFVDHDNQERNALAFLETLSPEAQIHIHQSIAADSNIDVDTAARRYAADIHGVTMDLTLLSIGTDGHIASLFPGSWDSDAQSDVIAIHNAPKDPPRRISFSLHKINESARVWIMASGSAKTAIIQRLLSEDMSLPATHVKGREETLLITDISYE